MKHDVINNSKENPTQQILNSTMRIKEIFMIQTLLLETYLKEYCEVNGITEEDLKKDFQVATCPSDFSVVIESTKTPKMTLFGVRFKVELVPDKCYFSVFGSFVQHKDKYPKTVALMASDNVRFDGTGYTIPA